jgi:hypothetical protein
MAAPPAAGVLPVAGSPFSPFVWSDAQHAATPFAIMGDSSQARTQHAQHAVVTRSDVTRFAWNAEAARLCRCAPCSCCRSRLRRAHR